jgi:hypothetical protein
MRRYTVRDAADMLGISTGAVRNRLSRGTLRSVKDGGTVYVLLPADISQDAARDAGDIPGDTPLVEELRDRVRYLEGIITTRGEEIRRRDVIISQLTDRIPAIEAQASPESPESPTAATEQPGRVESQPQVEGAQDGAERRSWWREFFGVGG